MSYNNGIAVDFDGTLFTSNWPRIGKPRKLVIWFCKWQQKKGTKIILWTCRQGPLLQEAVEACRAKGLEFDAVNDNPFSCFAGLPSSRKIHADMYIDDRAIGRFLFW